MAKRGTVKWRSIQQEERVAKLYGGVRSPSSGAQAHDPGDVRTDTHLWECKQKGGEEKHATAMSLNLKVIEKAADEAWEVGLEPAMAYCLYAPDSVLADDDGNVHLVVRLMDDDVSREP